MIFGGEERLEDGLAELGRNSGPSSQTITRTSVEGRSPGPSEVTSSELTRTVTGPIAGLGGVQEQVDEDLLDDQRIAAHPARLGIELELELVRAVLIEGTQEPLRAVEDVAEGNGDRDAGSEPRVVEQAVHRELEPAARGGDLVDGGVKRALGEVEARGLQEVGVVDDAGDRVAELVRDAGHESPGRFEALAVKPARQQEVLLRHFAHQEQVAGLRGVARAAEHVLGPPRRAPLDGFAVRALLERLPQPFGEAPGDGVDDLEVPHQLQGGGCRLLDYTLG